MDGRETLGVPAHPGGMLVERPELTVGLVRATSRPSGLEVELLARRPPDRRSAWERQADIRYGRDAVAAAARHLLPEADEGMELRFARIDDHGRVHWSHPERLSTGTGEPAGPTGPTRRALYRLPPMFGAGSFVLAWPEIGFPETVVHLALPDRATVDRDTIGIWETPAPPTRPPDTGLTHREDPPELSAVEVERGRTATAPRLLRRAGHAVVVLTRLTAVGPFLSMEILSLARGGPAGDLSAHGFPPTYRETPRRRHSAAMAVVHGAEARWLPPSEATASGSPDTFEDTSEYLLQRPDADTLDLIVAWPAAGLPEAQLTIPLTPTHG